MRSIYRPDLLAGHVAIVTGGGSGIGLLDRAPLGSLGAKVAICGRKLEKLEAAKEALTKEGADAFAAACDIREVAQIESLVDAVRRGLRPRPSS
ncbi:MAG: SDR family NAD(P)-dependent oxidoreductase [Polyangiaceae bacterium]